MNCGTCKGQIVVAENDEKYTKACNMFGICKECLTKLREDFGLDTWIATRTTSEVLRQYGFNESHNLGEKEWYKDGIFVSLFNRGLNWRLRDKVEEFWADVTGYGSGELEYRIQVQIARRKQHATLLDV